MIQVKISTCVSVVFNGFKYITNPQLPCFSTLQITKWAYLRYCININKVFLWNNKQQWTNDAETMKIHKPKVHQPNDHAADQCLFLLLHKQYNPFSSLIQNFKRLAIFCGCLCWFVQTHVSASCVSLVKLMVTFIPLL